MSSIKNKKTRGGPHFGGEPAEDGKQSKTTIGSPHFGGGPAEDSQPRQKTFTWNKNLTGCTYLRNLFAHALRETSRQPAKMEPATLAKHIKTINMIREELMSEAVDLSFHPTIEKEFKNMDAILCNRLLDANCFV